MTTAVQERQENRTAAVERVLLKGDLKLLTEPERLAYYKQVCESLGLNPLTRPFDYLELQGKLQLYARRDCTEQLRKLHGVSIVNLHGEVKEGVYVVTAHARDKTGREDVSTGAVSLEGLKGEARANALMKCETKSKRRVTLSLCGLGFLDETEVETVPHAQPAPAPRPEAPAEQPKKRANGRLPADGAELLRRLKDKEALLVKAGVCEPGELMDLVRRRCVDAGFGNDVSQWQAPAILLAAEEVRAFEAACEGRRAAKAGA
jgi:hypothetical protein